MGFLTRPLDAALSSTSKIRLLRLLIEQNRTVSGREAARLTGTSRTAMLVAIRELAKLGLIHREEAGRQFLCRANHDNQLLRMALKPLFAAEADWPALFFSAVRGELSTWEAKTAKSSLRRKPDILAVWIFGSVAMGRDKPGSDVDLFVLTSSEKRIEPIRERLADCLTTWRRQFGADVRPIVMSYGTVSTQLHTRDKFLTNALRHARVVMGEIPKELRIGKANDNTQGQ